MRIDELTSRIAQSTDISEEQARKATEIVLTEVKQILPAALTRDLDEHFQHGTRAPIADRNSLLANAGEGAGGDYEI